MEFFSTDVYLKLPSGKFIYLHVLYMFMVTMTLAVHKDLKKRMEAFPEMNWSEVARQSFAKKVDDLEILRRFTSDSTITEEDAIRWGREVSIAARKRTEKLIGRMKKSE